MAAPYTGNGYKIWINRKDTQERITDEDIWVGNTPNDGKSKISSGYTKNDGDWSYVIFERWDDVLRAIDVEPSLSLSANTLNPGSASGVVTIAVFDCNTDWVLSENVPWASLDTTSGFANKGGIKLTLSENTSVEDRTVTVTATYDDGKTKTVVITQKGATPTISITAPSPIAATATTVSYSVTSNTNVTVKLGSQTKTTKNGSFQVPENTGSTPITYVITAFCTNYPTYSATTSVRQEGLSINISVTAPSPINASSTTINYTVTSNVDAVTVKLGSQTKTSKTGTFTVPENTGTTQITYTITASCTNYPSYSATTNVIQQGVSAAISITAVTPIEASSTTISYTATTNVQNVTITLDGSQTSTSKIGSFTIQANTATTDVTHTLVAVCTDYPGQSASINVIQKAFVPTLTLSALSSTIASTATTIGYRITSNTNTTVRYNGQEKHYNATSGTNDGFTVPVNETTDYIDHVITAFCTNYPTVIRTITIRQEGRGQLLPPEIHEVGIEFESEQYKYGIPFIFESDEDYGHFTLNMEKYPTSQGEYTSDVYGLKYRGEIARGQFYDNENFKVFLGHSGGITVHVEWQAVYLNHAPSEEDWGTNWSLYSSTIILPNANTSTDKKLYVRVRRWS